MAKSTPAKPSKSSKLQVAAPIKHAVNQELMEDALLVASVRKEQQLKAQVVEAHKVVAELNVEREELRNKLNSRLGELYKNAGNEVLANVLKSGIVPVGITPKISIGSHTTARISWNGPRESSHAHGDIQVELKVVKPTDVVELETLLKELNTKGEKAEDALRKVESELRDLPKYERLLKTALAEERLNSSKEGAELLKKIGQSPLLKQFQLGSGK